MARRNRDFRSRGSRPNRAWATINDTGFVTLAANSVLFINAFVPTNPGIDETVLRTVGALTIVADQAGTAEEQVGAFGMILVTDSATAIGVTALPDPVVNAGGDGWFLYQSFAQQSATETAGVGSVAYPFDSKAKRVFEGTGMVIAMMLTNSHSTFGLEFNLQLRILAQVRGTR